MEVQGPGTKRINTKTKSKKRKILKKVLLVLLSILFVGITYEQMSLAYDNRTYEPVGQLINVNGHEMHTYSKGQGKITVIFASGWKTPSPYVDLYPLYNEISKHTRIAVYERPGYGWSDVANTPRDIDTITKELHELLEKSGEKPPYILVGHSIGSLEVIRFAQVYKDEVKGVVLIDGSNPDMYFDMVKASKLAYLRASMVNNLIYLLNKSGVTRLLFNSLPNFYSSTPLSSARNNLALAPDNFKEIDRAMFLKTFNNRNQVDEGDNKEINANRVAANGYLKDVPLRIITSEELNSYKESRENQLNLKNWSTDSKQIIVKGAGHAIHWANPELINNEILEILNDE